MPPRRKVAASKAKPEDVKEEEINHDKPEEVFSTCQTLYIKNLNEKIKKPELRKCLYALFSQYGQIIDLVASKAPRHKGQAFIVYKELASSVNALRSLQSYPFFNKPMVIQFAKSQSKASKDFEQFVLEPARKDQIAAAAGPISNEHNE